MTSEKYFTILGIRFFAGTVREALALAMEGGLTVAPSGPGLSNLTDDDAYRESIENADLVLPDSGFMVLCWRLLRGKRLKRLSGLEFLKALIADEVFKSSDDQIWVMPDEVESEANRAWLRKRGIVINKADCYIAPDHGSGRVIDLELKTLAEQKKPRFIIINIGGGVQEKLGYYLMRQLDYRPSIICTGAAISFLTGIQAEIPTWADKLYLGWLLRCWRTPRLFLPRYWRARNLFFLLKKYGEKSPK